jgi:NADH-quinone oxidoreductase subunit N
MNPSLHLVDFAALSPLLILLLGSLCILLAEAFLGSNPEKRAQNIFMQALMYLTLAAALMANHLAPASDNALLTPWISFTALSKTFSQLFLWIGLATTLLIDAFLKRFEATRGEFYFLLLASLFGLLLIGLSNDFLTLFLGLETLSISLYILCNYMKQWKISQESAIKFFLTGSIAAAILLYGIALIYGALGTTRFDTLLAKFQELSAPSDKLLFQAGIALVTLGLCFKAAIVPFHQWAPDVYAGATNPVTAFLAVGSKAGAFVAFIQVFLIALPGYDTTWNYTMAFFIILTLIYANYVALKQTELRRFFAYSGVSHAGFLLIPFVAGTPAAIPTILFYLVVYAIATLGVFAVMSYLDTQSTGPRFDDLRGLYKRSPLAAAILTLCLLTLGGIPPTAGFVAKFLIFKVAFEAGYIPLVVVALLTTILSAYYYLRMVALVFSGCVKEEKTPSKLYPAVVIGVAACAGIILLSLYPRLP